MHFDRALIVEDLDEPREWLVELLPQAIPGVQRVDAACNLAQAYALLSRYTYPLAIVDWGLPDGTSELLIRKLISAKSDAIVIVATIHDDDAHVFPALAAGATGYILKSQTRAVVTAQLQRIEQGEPALSPSIAMRVLRHFSDTNSHKIHINSAQTAINSIAGSTPDITNNPSDAKRLTLREVDVLRLIAKGYKAPEAATILGISTQTTSSYVRDIYRKLGISSRAEAALEANRRGLVA